MIPKGLKAGDLFEDGGLTYMVKSVNKDGTYISEIAEGKKVTKAVVKEDEPKEEPAEEITEEAVKPSYTKTEINRASNFRLEEICKELGLKVGTGTMMKKAIIKELGL